MTIYNIVDILTGFVEAFIVFMLYSIFLQKKRGVIYKGVCTWCFDVDINDKYK